MNTISFRIKKGDEELVSEYASIYNLNLSSFIRETILEALERSRKEESYNHAVKQLEKLEEQTRRLIKNWLVKNLVNTGNPTQQGKALTGNLKGFWCTKSFIKVKMVMLQNRLCARK